MIDLEQINVWGTLAAALAAFALGGLWFSLRFGKAGESMQKGLNNLGESLR